MKASISFYDPLAGLTPPELASERYVSIVAAASLSFMRKMNTGSSPLIPGIFNLQLFT
jgi:hypothetical protein